MRKQNFSRSKFGQRRFSRRPVPKTESDDVEPNLAFDPTCRRDKSKESVGKGVVRSVLPSFLDQMMNERKI